MESTDILYALARWLGYAGAFLAIGAMVFHLAVLRSWLRQHPADAPVATLLSARAAGLGLLGGMLLMTAAGIRLWFQLQSLVAPGEAVTMELVRLILGETPWGRGWMAQLGAGMVTLGGYLAALAMPRLGWIGAGIGATLVAVTAPMTGHAVTETAGSAGRLLDALHLLGGSAWLGTLTVTLAAGLVPLARLDEAARGPLAARLIRAFSPVALIGATLAIVAGSLMSWRYLGATLGARFEALFGTPWGLALVIKLGILALVAGLGAWNWRVLLPKLGSASAAQRLQRSARAEILLGVLLLVVTAVLVALPMPAEAGGGTP